MSFLKGKTAIITGGGYAVLSDGRCGSIGYGIATAYAKEGANLVITGRNEKKLAKAKEELEKNFGIQVLTVAADITAGTDNEATTKMVVEAAIKEFGRIDVLINNAQELSCRSFCAKMNIWTTGISIQKYRYSLIHITWKEILL